VVAIGESITALVPELSKLKELEACIALCDDPFVLETAFAGTVHSTASPVVAPCATALVPETMPLKGGCSSPAQQASIGAGGTKATVASGKPYTQAKGTSSSPTAQSNLTKATPSNEAMAAIGLWVLCDWACSELCEVGRGM